MTKYDWNVAILKIIGKQSKSSNTTENTYIAPEDVNSNSKLLQADLIPITIKGSITLAFWMCSLDVRFLVECVFDVILSVQTQKLHQKRIQQ
jgi:hypothetical protein